MPFIAVTGSYCSGKSTVVGMFRQLGAVVYNVDREARRLYRNDSPLYQKIVGVFGKEVMGKRGGILRNKVAKAAFSSGKNLRKLNEITHPVLIQAIKEFLNTKTREDMVVVEVPLLFEKGLQSMFDYSVLVVSPYTLSLHRAKRLRGIKEIDFKRRVSFQLPQSEKKKLADFIIENNGTKRELKRKVVRIWKRIIPRLR